MNLLPYYISNLDSGLELNKKPFSLMDQAMQELYNAYSWRGRIKKRDGKKLTGRLARRFSDINLGNSSNPTWSFNIYTISAVVPETNAEIQPGTVVIYVNDVVTTGNVLGYTIGWDCEVTTTSTAGLSTGSLVYISGVVVEPGTGGDQINGGPYIIELIDGTHFKLGVASIDWGKWQSGGTWTSESGGQVFTDQGNGRLELNPVNPVIFGTINYLNGNIVIKGANGGLASSMDFAYAPGLSVMGIWQREIAGINNNQTIFFDQKYAYVYDGSSFSELSSSTPTTWISADNNFFWATNYRGSDPSLRLFFETNFVNQDGTIDPMHYYDGITWTQFQPTVGAQVITEVSGTLVTPWMTFNGSLVIPAPSTGAIQKGSVTITVENDVDGLVTFRDTKKDGTLSSSGANNGTINYGALTFTLNLSPAFTQNATVTATFSYGSSFLFTALILIPYYGRLLALNVWEGTAPLDPMTEPNGAAAKNIFNRCRFSQVGDPTQQDAWRSDIIGKGGFIDAPINQQIISATYYKNTLIVFFEDSTWQLRYVGEYGLPFIWERISSDFGGESTFSPVLFDTGVLAVGDKAIVSSSGIDVKRIDLSIPDLVFQFQNEEFGPQRVHGIRDYQKELVYWCYPDGNINGTVDGNVYPNRVLVYNYRNNTFSIFRDNVTCFGVLSASSVGILWNDQNVTWDSENVFWKDNVIGQFPLIVSGNQQGFVHYFGYPDLSVASESQVNAMDQESLSITGVNIGTTPPQITVVNHNLDDGDGTPNDSNGGEIIYITGMNFLDPISGAVVPNSFNNNFFLAIPDPTNLNLLYLWQWNATLQTYVNNFPVTASTDYVGGGRVTLFPKMSVITKDFSPFIEKGLSTKLSYIDFLTDAMSDAYTTVNIYIDSSKQFEANLDVGTQSFSNALSNFGNISEISLTNPCVITTSLPHGMVSGDVVVLQNILGTTQLNGAEETITYTSPNSFSIPIDATGFSTYVSNGTYRQLNNPFYVPGSNYAWHRFFCGSYGQFISAQLTYDDNLMNTLQTHQKDFVMNAMRLWVKPGNRGVW